MEYISTAVYAIVKGSRRAGPQQTAEVLGSLPSQDRAAALSGQRPCTAEAQAVSHPQATQCTRRLACRVWAAPRQDGVGLCASSPLAQPQRGEDTKFGSFKSDNCIIFDRPGWPFQIQNLEETEQSCEGNRSTAPSLRKSKCPLVRQSSQLSQLQSSDLHFSMMQEPF